MYGAPPDVDGECNARLFLGDDHGDGTCTVRCQLQPDHDGRHSEKCRTGEDHGPPEGHEVSVTWAGDDRIERAWSEFVGSLFHLADDPEAFDWIDEMPPAFNWQAVWAVMMQKPRPSDYDRRVGLAGAPKQDGPS
jgi:hypothetical protein